MSTCSKRSTRSTILRESPFRRDLKTSSVARAQRLVPRNLRRSCILFRSTLVLRGSEKLWTSSSTSTNTTRPKRMAQLLAAGTTSIGKMTKRSW
ncbi:hypothetical protein T439DRAFT_325654 [Meredithblackwellia eburnea MCA 4105]